MIKVRTHNEHKQGKIFSFLVFIAGFGIGLTLPIYPNFVKSIIDSNSGVSLFYSAMAVIMMFAALGSTYFFKKIDRTDITKASFFILSVSFFLLLFTTRIASLSVFTAFHVVFMLLMTMVLSLFVRDFADEKNLGEEEGLFFKYHNLGYLLGPLAGGFIATWMGYEILFILTSLTFMGGFFYFQHLHIVQEHPAIVEGRTHHAFKFFKNLVYFFKNKNRAKVYVFTLSLMTFIGFKRLYIPLYVLYTGYVESMTGIILALTIVPLIFIEERIGKYADKHGVRKPITLGFAIMALSLFLIFLSPFPLLNFAILIIGHIGMAFVEPLQEYFLFKNMKEEDEDKLYGIYMTADPMAYFLAPALGGLVLLTLPFNYIFLLFGTLMLLAGTFTWFTLKRPSPDALPQES